MTTGSSRRQGPRDRTLARARKAEGAKETRGDPPEQVIAIDNRHRAVVMLGARCCRLPRPAPAAPAAPAAQAGDCVGPAQDRLGSSVSQRDER